MVYAWSQIIQQQRNVKRFLVHLGLPTGTTALNVEAMLTLSEDYDVVIGMDIISLCDFCFTNKDNASCFFVTPSFERENYFKMINIFGICKKIEKFLANPNSFSYFCSCLAVDGWR